MLILTVLCQVHLNMPTLSNERNTGEKLHWIHLYPGSSELPGEEIHYILSNEKNKFSIIVDN